MRGSAAFRVAVAPGGALAGPWVQNSLWTAARAVPSLDLRFAENKSLVDATTGAQLVTFTRASSGTFVGSDGVLQTAATDAPRFDHNPTTGESLGLLVEEARTNLNLYSEDFGNAAYSFAAATVSTNTTVAPDSTTTADTINSSGTAVVSQLFTKAASAITYTGSLFVKGTVTAFSFTIDDGITVNRGRAVFNLSTGTVSSTNNDGTFTGTTATITAFPNGWYRLTITTTTNILTTARLRLFWTGAGTSLDFWGAQLEAGAFPTSYIPTTTTTATRAADVASIGSSAFSSWYRQDEGTVFAGFRQYSFAAVAGVASIDDSTTSNRIQLRVNTLGAAASVVSTGGSVQANYSTSNTSQALQPHSAATSYKADDFSLCLNGGAISTDSAGSIPTVNQLVIGNNVGANPLNGTIKRLTYWPVRLGNNVLQQVTQ